LTSAGTKSPSPILTRSPGTRSLAAPASIPRRAAPWPAPGVAPQELQRPVGVLLVYPAYQRVHEEQRHHDVEVQRPAHDAAQGAGRHQDPGSGPPELAGERPRGSCASRGPRSGRSGSPALRIRRREAPLQVGPQLLDQVRGGLLEHAILVQLAHARPSGTPCHSHLVVWGSLPVGAREPPGAGVPASGPARRVARRRDGLTPCRGTPRAAAPPAGAPCACVSTPRRTGASRTAQASRP